MMSLIAKNPLSTENKVNQKINDEPKTLKEKYDTKWDDNSKVLLAKLTHMLEKTNLLKNMKLWSQDDGVSRFILSKKPKTNNTALYLLRKQFEINIIKECEKEANYIKRF